MVEEEREIEKKVYVFLEREREIESGKTRRTRREGGREGGRGGGGREGGREGRREREREREIREREREKEREREREIYRETDRETKIINFRPVISVNWTVLLEPTSGSESCPRQGKRHLDLLALCKLLRGSHAALSSLSTTLLPWISWEQVTLSLLFPQKQETHTGRPPTEPPKYRAHHNPEPRSEV